MTSDNAPAPSSDQMASSKPILVVDDDLVVLRMLRTVLQEEGFPVETVNNAGGALLLLEQTLFSLILTDLMMPSLSGLEFADLLRRYSRTAAIPVILMTAFPPPGAETRVAAVISKPFALDELLRVVRQFWPH